MRLSIIVEWANTRLHGSTRAWRMLDIIGEQWQQIAARSYPAGLPNEGARCLDQLDRRPELLIAFADDDNAEFEPEVRRRAHGCFDVGLHGSIKTGYHQLKHFGAQQASGDILLFLDSDVLPDKGWLAHLLASFACPEVQVVFGQPYVATTDVVSRTFALGWIYKPRDEAGRLVKYYKLYPNNTAFRAEVYHRTGFRPIGLRSRGASSALMKELAAQGIPVWQNSNARVEHPPPLGIRHMAIRALAHARDYYMSRSEKRHLGGLAKSLGVAVSRLGQGCWNVFRHRRRVGLKFWQVPAALAILIGFYSVWVVGGILTHINPMAMGRRFQV